MREDILDILSEMTDDDKKNDAFGQTIFDKLVKAYTAHITNLYQRKDMVISEENAEKEAKAFTLRLYKLAISIETRPGMFDCTFYMIAADRALNQHETDYLCKGGYDSIFEKRVLHELSIATLDVQNYSFMFLMSYLAHRMIIKDKHIRLLEKIYEVIKN